MLFAYFLVDWVLVSDVSECSGSEIDQGQLENVIQCGERCRGVSTMFIFGTNDYGKTPCENGKCRCWCETSATTDGTCDITTNNGFRLYAYVGDDFAKGMDFISTMSMKI